MSDTDSLSAEDLRSRLYHSLRQKGLVDSLKSQLRNKLVTELQQIGLKQDFNPEGLYAKEGALLHKAANSLVADHLRRCNYDYSLSVFLPESGTAQEKIYTTRDLLQLLRISPHSRIYKNVASYGVSGNKQEGFLWQFLSELASQHAESSRETGIQTEQTIPSSSSLDAKLGKVDEYYSELSGDSKTRSMAIEERILLYQRQLEERSRTGVELEVSRFKDTELTRMRLDERERCRKEMDQSRREMESTYRAKSDALLARERNAIERLQQQQEIAEKETFNQRQLILQEIDVVRQREVELRRSQEINNREKQLLEDKVKSREQLVKKREDKVKQDEIMYNQRLHDEMTKYKLEEQARYLERYKDLEYREFRVKENERKLDEELGEIKQVKDELRSKRIKVNELEAEVHRARQELIVSKTQSEVLSEKMRDLADYQLLKEENAVLKRELDGVKTRLTDANKDLMVERQKQEGLLREMGELAAKPAPEVYLLQRELEKLRTNIRQEQAVAEHQRQQAQSRLQEEMDRNHELLNKFEEQTAQQKEMNRELADLRQQLGQTKQALNNEIYRKPKSSIAFQRSSSLCDLADDDDNHFNIDHDNIDLRLYRSSLESRPPGLQSGDLDIGNDHNPNSQSDDYSYSFDLVKETKRRLQNLEQEAENLEQNYRDYQFRMTNIHSHLPSEPPVRTKVSFMEDNYTTSYTRAPLAASSSHSRSRTLHSRSKRSNGSFGTSESRPLSSTPAKDKQLHSPPTYNHHDREDEGTLNLSVSTVRSTSPTNDDGRRTGATKSGPLSVLDLEARPGSPSVLVIEGSQSQAVAGGFRAELLHVETDDFFMGEGTGGGLRISPPGQEGSDQEIDALAAKRPSQNGESSVRPNQEEETRQEEEKRRQEEEDQEYEERRRKREEERKKKEEEAWEREQQALRQLQNKENSDQSASEHHKEEELKEERKEETKTEEKGDLQIDPVMQKYMQMVQQQKEREKEEEQITKKAVDVWSHGRAFSQEKTPTSSENELSAADDEKTPQGGVSDDDSGW